MALTNAELEFMAKTTASLRSIHTQLERIADALTIIAGTANENKSSNPKTEETV